MQLNNPELIIIYIYKISIVIILIFYKLFHWNTSPPYLQTYLLHIYTSNLHIYILNPKKINKSDFLTNIFPLTFYKFFHIIKLSKLAIIYPFLKI